MHLIIDYDPDDWRRDPATLSQLLCSALSVLAQGGDTSSTCSTFPSHLNTLQAAAREVIPIPTARKGNMDREKGQFKPAWLDLLTLMFHCYVQRMRAEAFPHPSPESDPLIDALLLFCDCPDISVLSSAPGFCPLLGLLSRCIDEGLPSPHSSNDDTSFLMELRSCWELDKRVRLDLSTRSLMPWSTDSIKEGSLSRPTPSTEQAHIYAALVLVAYRSEKLLTFPDMPWLGSSHDGHARYDSLTAYVAARWSPSFTAYDNAALWQAAMTFGVLEAITDLNIPEALLLEKRLDGTVVFTCRNIGVIVYHWIFRVLLYDGDRGRRGIHSMAIILRAQRALDQAHRFDGRDVFSGLSGSAQEDLDDISCTISVILNALRLSIAVKTRGTYNFEYENSGGGGHAHSVVNIFSRRMVAAGWCPSTSGCFQLAEPRLWWYASTFQPFVRHSPGEHRNCSDTSCTVHSIDEATYKTAHTTAGCECSFLTPSFHTLGRILRSGRIPVISYTDRGALAVHSARLGLPYIAVSHVWADGLGSSTEKGLPTCQIERIHRHVRGLLGPRALPAFWIDGLCIPEERELRNEAIIMMRKTYEDADKVLVFDSSIRTLCSSTRNPEDNIFRIGASTWMQRVWTLQEALLARELHFEFSEGVVSAASLLGGMRRRGSSVLGFQTIRRWVESTPTTSILESRGIGNEFSIREISALLFRRSTGKRKDEPLAIAGLLNVIPEKIISQPDLESRIRTLFTELGTLPVDLMYKDYVRMRTPGFRWCPVTLTSIGDLDECPFEINGTGDAMCTSGGLTTKHEVPVICLPRIIVLDVMEPFLVVKVPKIGAFYSLEDLSKRAPQGQLCSINALLPRPRRIAPFPTGTAVPVVAVNIPEVEDGRDVEVKDDIPIRCEYTINTLLQGQGDVSQSWMDGRSVIEGRLIMAKVTVT